MSYPFVPINNQTACTQNCLTRFAQPEKDANEENAICLSTAALGTFILFSGINDLCRAGEPLLQRSRKYSIVGNSILGFFALYKIAMGVCFIWNAFAYKPFLWNTELFTTCTNVCTDLLKNPPPTPSPTNYFITSQCCLRCNEDLLHPKGAHNFAIATGFGVPFLVMETVKTIYSICKAVMYCVQQTKSSVIRLPLKTWKIANTDLLKDALVIAYGIAIFILISSNVVGDDNNIYDFTSSFSFSESSGSSFLPKCSGFCNSFYPWVTRDYCES